MGIYIWFFWIIPFHSVPYRSDRIYTNVTPIHANTYSRTSARQWREGEEDKKATHLYEQYVIECVDEKRYCWAHNRNWLSIVSVGFSCYLAVVAATKTSSRSFEQRATTFTCFTQIEKEQQQQQPTVLQKNKTKVRFASSRCVNFTRLFLFLFVFNTWICRINVKKKIIQFDFVVATSTLREVAIEFSAVFISVDDKELQFLFVFISQCGFVFVWRNFIHHILPFIE